jgi:hypothetical protein
VASFGIFSGVLVGVNYVCDLVYFPTAIILYSEKIRPKIIRLYSWFFGNICCLKRFKCVLRKKNSDSLKNQSELSMSSISFLCSPHQKAKKDALRLFPKLPPLTKGASFEQLQDLKAPEMNISSKVKLYTNDRKAVRKEFEERMLIVRFLRHRFFSFLSLRIVRFTMPVLFVGISSFFIYSATRLEPDSKEVQ